MSECEAKAGKLTSHYFRNRTDKYKSVRDQGSREYKETLRGRRIPPRLPLPPKPLSPFPNPSPRFLLFLVNHLKPAH